ISSNATYTIRAGTVASNSVVTNIAEAGVSYASLTFAANDTTMGSGLASNKVHYYVEVAKMLSVTIVGNPDIINISLSSDQNPTAVTDNSAKDSNAELGIITVTYKRGENIVVTI